MTALILYVELFYNVFPYLIIVSVHWTDKKNLVWKWLLESHYIIVK